MGPEVSVVVPLYNEASNVQPLYNELVHVLGGLRIRWEILFVDDGSVDGTWEKLVDLHGRGDAVRLIRLERNFGQTAAFAAGFAYSQGRFIVTMDGDLQNDPADIPRLLELAKSHDVVCGWRKDRKDAFLTRYVPAVVANWLLGIVSGVRIHDNGCSLKVFRAEVVKPLRLQRGMHRYLAALASRLGGRVTEVVVNHRPRRFGRSKYGLSRTFKVIADLVRLRGFMRAVGDVPSAAAPMYEIGEIVEQPRDAVLERRV